MVTSFPNPQISPLQLPWTAWLLVLLTSASNSWLHAGGLVEHDLTPLHDPQRVLLNPHKGWYHHFPDNHPDKYRVQRDEDLLEFPGMDHIYLRLAWAYLEPEEGQYQWTVIDQIISKWTALGLGISMRISCKETSTDRLEQQFATPQWVKAAGARGGFYRMGEATGPDGPWEPEFDDPIFLAKLDHFLAALAARYDGRPWLRYLDIGSVGDWGEGHTWAGSRKECGFAARMRHVDLHLKHFRRTQLMISDDFVYALSDRSERQALHAHILTNGISYRDDSILVNGYLSGLSASFTVRSPQLFADAYLRTPTVLELEHYSAVKKLGNWEGRAGSLVEKHGQGRTGPDYFRGALGLLHASYIGYHGHADEWLRDNPELTKELLNRCGYWLFPLSISLPEEWIAGTMAPLQLTVENRGVAPPYHEYKLRIKLTQADKTVIQEFPSGCTSWKPSLRASCPFEVSVPPDMPLGKVQVAIGLFHVRPDGPLQPVEWGLRASLRDRDGFYQMATATVSRTR